MTTRDTLQNVARALEEVKARQTYRRFEFFTPYAKQREFMALGATKRERLLMAGNQLGKTETGAYELALHLTGLYPDDWKGRRWDRPVKFWASGVTSLSTRDVVQKKLMGEPGIVSALGTGMIPKFAILDKSLARGVTDAFDTVSIKHKSGGISVLKFKSYEQGREKWQGDTLDGIWFDEEPPGVIYDEGLTRTVATGGMVYVTFTPLLGMSEVVLRFLQEQSPDRAYVTMTIDDVGHISPEEKVKIVAGYKSYEREARAMGVPMLGSGRVFQTPEADIAEDPLTDIPPSWKWLWGIDFGVGHPFAAALVLWDTEADVIHVHHAIRMRGEDGENESRPLYHAEAMKPFGWIPVAWPQDGTQHKQSLGQTMPLAQIYKQHGLRMLDQHAKWEDGTNSTEAGVTEMDERFATGKLRVNRNLSIFFEEYRMYHREKGLLVKVHDDVLSAIRVAIMAKRFARPHAQLVKPGRHGNNGGMARNVDFDLFRT